MMLTLMSTECVEAVGHRVPSAAQPHAHLTCWGSSTWTVIQPIVRVTAGTVLRDMVTPSGTARVSATKKPGLRVLCQNLP
jgi:hypothetical protein